MASYLDLPYEDSAVTSTAEPEAPRRQLPRPKHFGFGQVGEDMDRSTGIVLFVTRPCVRLGARFRGVSPYSVPAALRAGAYEDLIHRFWRYLGAA